MLYWGGVGFYLITYRLEEGRFQWYKGKEIKSINYKEMEWLLDGIKIEQKRYHKEVKKRYII